MSKRWKRISWTASALTALLLTGQILPPAAWAEPFEFVDEEGEEWESGRIASESEFSASGSELSAGRSELFSLRAGIQGLPASPSVVLYSLQSVSSLGDLWDDWDGDFTFLDGSQGLGTKEKPYQIKTSNQLMGLSQLAAMGMKVEPGEGREEIIGSYEGAYFQLSRNLDLGGMEWNPIGYYQDSSEFSGKISHPFCGHFDGNGKTVSNFRLTHSTYPGIGFFGAVENGTVEHLTLRPGTTVTGAEQVGILAGSAVNSRIADCTVEGDLRASGSVGGIVGQLEGDSRTDSVIENCTARVTLYVTGGSERYAGGIAGKAAGSSLVDCRTETGDNSTARIQGPGAAVGGITGFQNDTAIYNCYVSGTIGGAGSQTVGGITGQYASGHLKVARFEGTIGQSGLGTADHRGAFIGNREAGDWFRYGEDVAWLFTDTEAKLAAGVCGSRIPDDNEYTYGAKIGYSHSGDLFYTLVQGGVTRPVSDQYYYEVLEQGILSVLDEDLEGETPEVLGYELDHVAPNDAGQPVRGYLITVPQIDTISGGTNYYDVAVLEARGNNTYYRTIDKNNRGAVEAGRTVTVTTSPKHTDAARFQMDGVPTYTEQGREKEMSAGSGGSYQFTMPEENTEIRAVYEKVAVKVAVVPSEYRFRVIEERTGDRRHPVKTTRVLNQDGKLIATYINGLLAEGTKVQPVTLEAVVDKANDVADSSVSWSVDDPDLMLLLPNGDEDTGGYTKQSASLQLNLNAGFFTDTIRKLEEEQAKSGYRYPIPDTIYGAGHQNGGTVILTAKTRPSASFEGKPCTANARILVTYQVKDQSYPALEKLALDQSALEFTVTRRLTGNRNNPKETVTVTAPETLTAKASPEFYAKKAVTWSAEDPSVLTVNGEDGSALVSAKKDAKWIQDLMAADDGIRANNASAVLKGSGVKKTKVLVTAEDWLGNRQTAVCEGSVRFVTVDETSLYGSYGSGSSSGRGGSSSGRGGSSSGGSGSGSSASGGSGPAGAAEGIWTRLTDGRWKYTDSSGLRYRKRWAYIANPYAGSGQNPADWFYFDEDGYMVTGWHWIADADGKEHCYYLNEIPDGTLGRLFVSGRTPDGYQVNEKGQWTENGTVQERASVSVTAFGQETGGDSFGVGKGGFVFAAQHPEITDPEYFLQEAVNYDPAAVQELKRFVLSFDWIHADELTRAQMVHDRIANGFHGNTYGSPEGSFSVLLHGHGVCKDFAEEFMILGRLVGLDVVVYTSGELHEACLVRIGTEWYATDPTSTLPFLSEGKTVPVDFETEYHRYEREAVAAQEKFLEEHPTDLTALLIRLDQKLAAGEITAEEYNEIFRQAYTCGKADESV